VTHELSEGERTLWQRGFVGSFIDTRPWSSRWFEKPDSRPGERPQWLAMSGLPCATSTSCRVCYLLGRVSQRPFLVAIGDVSADAFPGEYISCTLTTPPPRQSLSSVLRRGMVIGRSHHHWTPQSFRQLCSIVVYVVS
jgi:hypothetical protein